VAPLNFTILGGSGFIGGHLRRHLGERGHRVDAPARDVRLEGQPLGHVIYAIGLTGDFRSRPFDTVEAHVSLLSRLLAATTFESWLYLSSTRVVRGASLGRPVREDDAVAVQPSPDALYDLSKLAGEALCVAQLASTVRVARLSNVYGPGQGADTFLGSVVAALRRGEDVEIREAPTSSKDYVHVDDVCVLLERIALEGRARTYHVASGESVTHDELAGRLRALTGRHITFAPQAPQRAFPPLDVSRVQSEFGFRARRLLDHLSELLAPMRANVEAPRT